MASVTFALKEPNSKSLTLIYLIFRFNSLQWKFSTEQKILPKFWNPETNKARESRSFPGASELNNLLTNCENGVLNTYRKLINDKEQVKREPLREAIDIALSKEIQQTDKKDFFAFIDNFITTSNKKLNTVKQYRQAERVLKEYQEAIKVPITFESIDLDFYESYVKHLNKKGYYTNSVGGFVKNLKVFMGAAVDRGLTKNMAYKHSKFRKVNEESESIYLSTNELKTIYELKLEDNERLDKVRDLFIIGCYTGLRFSDLSKLSSENIIDKNSKIKILTEKTGELVIIPLHPFIKDILEKNNGEIPRVISNQKMNEYLKELGEKAKFNDSVTINFTKGGKQTKKAFPKYDLITVHTARRSFATNAYLNDIPSISIMKITGHRTEKAFLKYIKISQEDNANKLLNHPFFKLN